MTVELTGVANAQTIAVKLSGVTSSAGQVLADKVVNISFLVGDTNGDGSVSASDIGQTKYVTGQMLTGYNYRSDVNASGAINASDIGLVKSVVGTRLP
jgi:hypothetical protein